MKENCPSLYLYFLWISAVTNTIWHDIGVQQGNLMWPSRMLDFPDQPEWTGIILHVNQASDLSSTWCLTAATSCLSHLTVNVIVLSSTHFHEPMERLFKRRRPPNASLSSSSLAESWLWILHIPPHQYRHAGPNAAAGICNLTFALIVRFIIYNRPVAFVSPLVVPQLCSQSHSLVQIPCQMIPFEETEFLQAIAEYLQSIKEHLPYIQVAVTNTAQ